jgi:hypothetical protein
VVPFSLPGILQGKELGSEELEKEKVKRDVV